MSGKKIFALIVSALAVFSNAGAIISSAQESAVRNKTNTSVVIENKPLYKFGVFEYMVDEDGAAIITDCDESVTSINLDGLVNGRNISKIANGAFSKCKKLRKATLSETLIEIGDRAFANTPIEMIVIPCHVERIGTKAFANCRNLKNVYAYSVDSLGHSFGKNIFTGCNENISIISYTDSDYIKYGKDNKILTEIDEGYKIEKEDENAEDVQEEQPKVDPNVRIKYIKGKPDDLEDTSYTYHHKNGGYYFDRSGLFVSDNDYTIMCNCVAYEYGANWVPEWEMALVCEVIFNTYSWGYSSLRDVIVKPGRFEGVENYMYLDGFSNKVNNRVISAVNTYCSFPEYFNEGYTQFRGDGTWNWFF